MNARNVHDARKQAQNVLRVAYHKQRRTAPLREGPFVRGGMGGQKNRNTPDTMDERRIVFVRLTQWYQPRMPKAARRYRRMVVLGGGVRAVTCAVLRFALWYVIFRLMRSYYGFCTSIRPRRDSALRSLVHDITIRSAQTSLYFCPSSPSRTPRSTTLYFRRFVRAFGISYGTLDKQKALMASFPQYSSITLPARWRPPSIISLMYFRSKTVNQSCVSCPCFHHKPRTF